MRYTSENILPVELQGKYKIIHKQFLHKLLKQHIHPNTYITKSLTPSEQTLHNLLIQMVDEHLQTGIDYTTQKKIQELAIADVKQRQEIFQELENQLHNIANNKAPDVETIITEFYNQGAIKGYNNINREVVFTKADEYSLYHINQYTFDQIKNLSNDLTTQIRTEIWRGIGEGASIPTIQNRILETGITPLNVNGRVLSPVTRAEMIARTETARARNTGSLQAYSNYGLEQGELLTAGDGRVCEDCLDLESNNPHSLKELSNIAPIHPNCKCAVGPYLGGDGYDSQVVDNPIIIDTTTDNTEETLYLTDIIDSNINSSNNEEFQNINYGNENLEWRPLTETKISELNLPDLLKSKLIEFSYRSSTESSEFGFITNFTKNENYDIKTNHEKNVVTLNVNDYGRDRLGITHSHLDNLPFNDVDFERGLKSKGYVECMVVETPNCVYTAEFKETISNLEEFMNNFKKEYANGYLKDWSLGNSFVNGRNIIENFKNNEILNKYVDFNMLEK